MSHTEELSSKVAGYKATLSNPKVSEEAKENARNVLDNELDGGNVGTGKDAEENHEKNPNNVAGGLKAALNNPNTTEEGKKAVQEKLDNLQSGN